MLVDERDRVVEHGRGAPPQWPAADRREAILAAGAVRVVVLDLPPLPAHRVEQAVAYALEERLATPLETSVVVAGPQGADGRIVVLVASRALARALASQVPPFARILAEPLLAQLPPADTWRWCAAADHGFVRTGRGEAFAVDASDQGTLPVELKLALEQAARAGRAPERVLASVEGAAAHRDAWTRSSGVPFEPAPPWRWDVGDGVPADDLAAALAREPAAPAARPTRRRSLAFALTLLVAAGVLHLLATAGTWAWRKMELARTEALLADVVRVAGATDADDLARRHAQARHRAGNAVPQDAWPRLAQAAPALAALPPGALRSARFSGGAWTLDLGAIDEAALAAFDARLRSVGMNSVSARTPAGVRVRIEGDA